MMRKLFAGKFLSLLPWLVLIVLVPFFPAELTAAALKGMAIWWEVLFPALFPFFVVTELLLGFGIVHFIGTLFDPLMRPLFRVPGYGGFVMAMGFSSGYPIGARLTAELWKERLVNRVEGERMVAFTTSSDPIFLIGAVCVGFFHDASLAVVLAAAHYGGSVLVGLIMRFYGKDKPSSQKTGNTGKTSDPSAHPASREQVSILRRAVFAMHQARLADDRSMGELIRDAVKAGLKLVMMVGSLVVFISVVLELLTRIGVLAFLRSAVSVLLGLFSLPEGLSGSLVNGLFEVTLGAQAAGSGEGGLSLVHRAAMAGFVLSWAGLSVHAQIVSLLTETDLRYRPFVQARLLHGLITMVLVYVLWTPLSGLRELVTLHVPAASFGGPDPSLAAFWLCPVLFLASLSAILLLRTGHLLSSRLLWIMMKRTKPRKRRRPGAI